MDASAEPLGLRVRGPRKGWALPEGSAVKPQSEGTPPLWIHKFVERPQLVVEPGPLVKSLLHQVMGSWSDPRDRLHHLPKALVSADEGEAA